MKYRLLRPALTLLLAFVASVGVALPAYADGNATTNAATPAAPYSGAPGSGGGAFANYGCGGSDGMGAASASTGALDTSYIDPYNPATTDAPFANCTYDPWNTHYALGSVGNRTWCPAGFDQWNFYSSSNAAGAATFYTVSRIRVQNNCTQGVAQSAVAFAPSHMDVGTTASPTLVTPSTKAGGYEFAQPTQHIEASHTCAQRISIGGVGQSYCGNRVYLYNVAPYQNAYAAESTFATHTQSGTGAATSCKDLQNPHATTATTNGATSSNLYQSFKSMAASSDPTMSSANSSVTSQGYWQNAKLFWQNFTKALATSGQTYAYADTVNNIYPAVSAGTLGLGTVTAATFDSNEHISAGTHPTVAIWNALATYFGYQVPACSSYAQFMPDATASGSSSAPYIGTCIIPIQRQAHVWYASTDNAYEPNYTNPATSTYAQPAALGATGGVIGSAGSTSTSTWRGLIYNEVANRAATYYRVGAKFTNSTAQALFASQYADCSTATDAGHALSLPSDPATTSQAAILGAPTFKADGSLLPQLATISTGSWTCSNCASGAFLENLQYNVNLTVNGGNPNMLRALDPSTGEWFNCFVDSSSGGCGVTLQDPQTSYTCSSSSCVPSLSGPRNYILLPGYVADGSHTTSLFSLGFGVQSAQYCNATSCASGYKSSDLKRINSGSYQVIAVGKPSH